MRKGLIKVVRMTIVLAFFTNTIGYAQHGINTTLPNLASDLTLGSTDKGILFNRVKLVDRNSPLPLSTKALVPGMMVYNTNITEELSEGLYFWSSEKKWNKLFSKTVPTRQSDYITFKQENNRYDLKKIGVEYKLSGLDHTFSVREKGTVFLDYVVYADFTNGNVGSGTIEFITRVKNKQGQEVFKNSIAIAPMIVKKGEGTNSMTGKGNFFFDVESGQEYSVEMKAVTKYPSSYNLSLSRAGAFLYGGNIAPATMKITFLSEPNL